MDIAQVRRSRGYHILVGVGLVSYGLVHLMLAWLALQIALSGRGNASAGGALHQLARQPLGGILLRVMAIGLFTLVIWQILEATIGREQSGRDGRLRRRLASAGRAIVYLGLGILAAGVATGSSGGSGNGEQTLSARLMALPFGRVLVAAVGIAVIGVGISQVVKGVKQSFTEDLDHTVSQTIRRLGMVGYCAKGVSLTIIGGLFGYAALTYDPEEGRRPGRGAGHDQAPAVRRRPAGDHGAGDRLFRPVLLRLGP